MTPTTVQTCGKTRYPDRKAAQSAINLFNRSKRGRHGRPESVRSYACPNCHGWHLTKREEYP